MLSTGKTSTSPYLFRAYIWFLKKNVRYTGYSILLKVPVVLPSKNMYLMWVDVEYTKLLLSSKQPDLIFEVSFWLFTTWRDLFRIIRLVLVITAAWVKLGVQNIRLISESWTSWSTFLADKSYMNKQSSECTRIFPRGPG